MKQRIKKVYKRLPPHTYEAHPRANEGEASKPFVIAVIAIVAVVALALLLLFSEQLVGRAIYPGQPNTAGLSLSAPAYKDQDFTLLVKAHTGQEMAAGVNFELSLPQGVSCKNLVDGLNWPVKSFSCDPQQNKVTYLAATNNPVAGELTVATLTFAGVKEGDYGFKFTKFEVKKADKSLVTFKNDLSVPYSVEVTLKEQCDNNQDDDKDGKRDCLDTDCLGNNACMNLPDNSGCADSSMCSSGNCVSGSCISKKEVQQVCTPFSVVCDGNFARKQCKSDGSGYEAPLKCAVEEYCGIVKNTPTCVLNVCGDGKLEPNEQCDDGNLKDGDGCSSLCAKEVQPQQVCGNGKLDQGEQCDDSNVKDGDGCSSQCIKEAVCGNNKLEGNEQCDDGNPMPGDGCSPSCQLEKAPPLPPPSPLPQPGQVCTANQWVCDGQNARKLCNVNGTGYGASQSCLATEVCDAGACKAVPPQCVVDTDCGAGKVCSSGQCFLKGEEPVLGTKIKLTDVATANNVFSTKVTATETFTNEITIYTILYGPNNKVLSIKSEKVETGLAKDATYTATVNYPQANVKSKSVLVFDDKKAPSVYGQLQKPYG